MTDGEKATLLTWIREGHIQKAIDGLLAINRGKSLNKQADSIASRFSELTKNNRLGTLASESFHVLKNKVVSDLIDLINHPENKPYPGEVSPDKPDPSKILRWKQLITVMAILILVSLTVVLSIVLSREKSYQLTVFVTNIEGNVVLELEGKINIPLGNRSLNEIIGANGRTNFPDITADNIGDTIKVGLDAKGWEIAGKSSFVFTGEPIIIKVKRDNSLGSISGSVTSRNAQEFIEGAEVQINSDTVVYTDKYGIFKIILPESMRVKKDADPYQLTVSKAGYKKRSQHYYPNSSRAEIRLEKVASPNISGGKESPGEKLKRLKRELKNLEELFDKGEIDPVRFAKLRANLQMEIDKLEPQN